MKHLNAKRMSLALFVVFAVCFILVAFLEGKDVTDLWTALKIAYKTIPPVLLVAGFFVSYAWRWKIFHDWFVPFPDLNGTWQGVIQTTWVNPETGKAPSPIPVTLTIQQSFIKISCVMRTAEMTSRSYLAGFWLDNDEQVRMLGYSYHGKPLPTVADRSQPHEGTVVFEMVGRPVSKLKGIYWTARKTTGEVELTFRGQDKLDEFPNDLGKHPISGK